MTTFYDEIGGYDTIEKIVATFYRGVAQDPVLRPLYPEQDLGPAEERFRLFLVQYWGGPTTYSDRRGHPRLRMRHAPFAVSPHAAERWLVHFREGLDAVGLPPEQDARFWDYVQHAAQFMVNTFEEPDRPALSRARLRPVPARRAGARGPRPVALRADWWRDPRTPSPPGPGPAVARRRRSRTR